VATCGAFISSPLWLSSNPVRAAARRARATGLRLKSSKTFCAIGAGVTAETTRDVREGVPIGADLDYVLADVQKSGGYRTMLGVPMLAGEELRFVLTRLRSFSASNSVQPGGIHPIPGQTTGGNGPVTGLEVQFSVNFTTPFDLAAGHYFRY
jgi:hypothetical protein